MLRKAFIYFLMAAVLPMASCASSVQEQSREPHSEEELSGLTISTSSGTYYHDKFSRREDVRLFVASSEADALQAMRQGLSDVYVIGEVLLPVDEQKRLGVKKVFRGEESFDVAFALRKGNEGLRKELNAFLASAPLEDILGHWIDGAPDVPEPEFSLPADAPVLRCITALNLSPVCFMGEGGEWRGIDPELLRRFAHATGRRFQMSFLELSSALIALKTGQADIISGCLFVTEERQKAADFSIPYYRCHPGYYMLDKAADGRKGLVERIRHNLLTESRWKLIADGLLETVKITLFAILLGTLLGAGICACRRSRHSWLRSFADIYGSILEGIPSLVLLLIMFYLVFSRSGISSSAVAIITFALYFASSAGTVFDTALSAVPSGQTEAGLALGLTRVQTFIGIVLPQAIPIAAPLFSGQCVALLKGTSIVGYIAIQDLTRASDLIRSRTFDAVVPLLIVTVAYFLLAWLIRVFLNRLLLPRHFNVGNVVQDKRI